MTSHVLSSRTLLFAPSSKTSKSDAFIDRDHNKAARPALARPRLRIRNTASRNASGTLAGSPCPVFVGLDSLESFGWAGSRIPEFAQRHCNEARVRHRDRARARVKKDSGPEISSTVLGEAAKVMTVCRRERGRSLNLDAPGLRPHLAVWDTVQRGPRPFAGFDTVYMPVVKSSEWRL
jgi:hypothetical protein